MPSAVLLTGAPLHDLPVFWKNQSGAARTERLTAQMFTFECSSVASEEGWNEFQRKHTQHLLFSADSRQSRVGGEGLISLKLDLTVRSGSYIIKGVFQMSPMLETVQHTRPYTEEYGLFPVVTFSTRPLSLITPQWQKKLAGRSTDEMIHRSLWLEHIRPFQWFHVDRKWDVLASLLFLNSHK